MSDMTRQYKAMQNEMSLRIHQLESELARTRTQLGMIPAFLHFSSSSSLFLLGRLVLNIVFSGVFRNLKRGVPRGTFQVYIFKSVQILA